ncbi:MAG: transketolase [Candidatus Auribacterota bacterium]|nr:transketolase [Candidatus Auribacterota bacterium]
MDKISRDIRKQLVRMHQTGSHFGGAMSIVDILTVLYFKVMNIPSPDDPDRDRFILSKGHATSAWYVTLAKKGFFKEERLDAYLEDGGQLYGHPVRGGVPGIEASTGSLGHGINIGIGMALAGKNDGKDYKVYVLMGDGEVQEGSVWEGAMLASRLKLDNLVAIIDANKLQGFERVENIQPISTFSKKWESFGWGVRVVEGHNHQELTDAFLSVPFQPGSPSMVVARTVKGKGVADMEDLFESHYLSVPKDKVEEYLRELDGGVR